MKTDHSSKWRLSNHFELAWQNVLNEFKAPFGMKNVCENNSIWVVECIKLENKIINIRSKQTLRYKEGIKFENKE